MNSSRGYAEIQLRRRQFKSIGITILIYAIAIATGMAFEFFNPEKDLYSNKTVIVNLAGPETAEPGLGSIVAAPEAEPKPELKPQPQPQPQPQPSSPAPSKIETKTPVPETAPKPVKPAAAAAIPPAAPTASSVPAPAATPADAAVPSSSAKNAAPPAPVASAPQPVEDPWVAGERGPGSRTSATSYTQYIPGKGDVSWTPGTTIHKAEKGNSMDTALGGASGTVGQSLYVPIYLSLPLPREIPGRIYDSIPPLVVPPNTVLYTAQYRQKAFRNFYGLEGGVWRLKSDVPADQRGLLWEMLEDAGYDPSSADYKAGKNLAPVVIGFTVTKDKQLKGVEILQSSGDSAIDQAVLYGFKQASFWNKTGETVPGRFIYRF